MKKSRFTDEQIVRIVKQGEAGVATAEAKFGGLDLNEAQRLKQLEDENRKLKRIVAEQMLDLVMLKNLVAKKWLSLRPGERRWRSFGSATRISERRACRLVGVQAIDTPVSTSAEIQKREGFALSRSRAIERDRRTLQTVRNLDGLDLRPSSRYISWEQFERNQSMLADNAHMKSRMEPKPAIQI